MKFKKLLALLLCAACISPFAMTHSFATDDNTSTYDQSKSDTEKNAESNNEGDKSTDTTTPDASTDKESDKIEKDSKVKESGNVMIHYIKGSDSQGDAFTGSVKSNGPYDKFDVSKYEKVTFDGYKYSRTEKKVNPETGDLDVKIIYEKDASEKYKFNPSMKLRIDYTVYETKEMKKKTGAFVKVYPFDLNRGSVEYDGKEMPLNDFWEKHVVPEGYTMVHGFAPDASFTQDEVIGGIQLIKNEGAIVKDPKDEKDKVKETEKDKATDKKADDKTTVDKKQAPVAKEKTKRRLPITGSSSMIYIIVAAIVLIGVGVFAMKRKK